ncbi:hypothetical protein D9619_000569 [Psilocybe cf. subviscida]|uniref:Type 2A phosphatase activator TIP41 n=1 Tax=Psilocybe cf. subviscida TaxID=2480587 RepID=A0A8H5BF12_9AGAR|nr:hypothetical protein D9619_000569 [Psilocybe cf. subviscida]
MGQMSGSTGTNEDLKDYLHLHRLSYPTAKSDRSVSFCSSTAGLFDRADAIVDLPDEGCPKMSTCFAGIERDEETESRMDDHKSCGGASGVEAREISMHNMTAIPEHKLFESPNTRSIEIKDWRITVSTNSISNAPECDALQSYLGFPLPEMTFGNNYLTLEHRPSQLRYSFDTADALRCVKKGELGEGDGGVKVGTDSSSSLPMPKTVPTKPYDWTYTTTYAGHEGDDGSTSTLSSAPAANVVAETIPAVWRAADPEDPSESIPIAELTRPDPILFYAEIPLFEDELHDNGSSSLLVRIRVMPTCFFILSRFTLRVDQVLFRTFDTRIYHSFASSPLKVVREVSGWEAPYEQLKLRLPKRDDMTPLTDPTFIARILGELPKFISQKEGAKTGWRGLGIKKEIAVLRS